MEVKIALSLLLAGGCLLAQGSKASDPAARVVSAEQGWTVSGRAVARGTPISALDVLIGGTNASSLILDCKSAGWLAYDCGTRPCRVPACAAKIEGVSVLQSDPGGSNARAAGQPQRESWLDALIRRQPKDPVTAGVRAGGNSSDAIVLRDSRGIHWGPAFNRVLEGSYCFRLNTIPVSGGTPHIFTIMWDRSIEPEGIAAVPGVSQGLYSLDKGMSGANGNCSMDPDASAAWVLIVAEPEYSRVMASWKDNLPWFSHIEQSGANPSVVMTVRHAVLSALADSLRSQ